MQQPLHQRVWSIGRTITKWCLLITLTVVSLVIALMPIYWGLVTSFKPEREIISIPPTLWPENATLAHYQTLLAENILLFVRNSALNTAATMIICLVLGSMTAYALSRLQFRGKGFVLFFIVATMAIPTMPILIPLFFFFTKLGLTDKWFTLIIIYSAESVAFTTWVLKGFLETLPSELEKAAMVDGYTRLQTLYKVLLPLTKPALVTAALWIFLTAWNDYIAAVTLTSSAEARTVPVAVQSYLGFYGRLWGPLSASSIVAIVPVVTLFLLFRDYFIGGLTKGAVKG